MLRPQSVEDRDVKIISVIFDPHFCRQYVRDRSLVQLYTSKRSLSYTLSNVSICNNLLFVFLGVELKYKYTLSGHSAPVLACAFSYDGQMLVSG